MPLALIFDMVMVLRYVTFFWEIGAGRIAMPGPARFAAWVVFPFALYGPILRYSDFARQLDLRPGTDGTRLGAPNPLWRLFAGAVVLILGVALAGAHPLVERNGLGGKVVALFFIAPWTWYLQASGFAMLMQSFGSAWQFRVPENFNRPFGRTNIADFWANWNITATSVFRDYLFYNRWGRRRANVYVNVTILFLLVGVWHGSNAYWILWGAIHAAAFSAYLWYRQHGAFLKPLFAGRRGDIVGAVLTYVVVASAWVLPPQIIKVSRLLLG
jgi:D-alanyl-lipoteichoic acid acyltransferase DltB (MBOAT superfamily)